MKSRLHLPLLIACFALLAACGGKVIPTRDGDMPTWMGTLEDLRRYPQHPVEMGGSGVSLSQAITGQAVAARRLLFLTGTRADFGKLEPLAAAARDAGHQVTFFVTGNGFETLSVEIYARARQGISLEINALSGVMFIFSLVLVVGYYFIQRGSASHKAKLKAKGAALNETTH